MQRIVIIGSCGSGKTTLAHLMTKALGFPMTDLDDLYWRPNWTEADKEEFHGDINRAVDEKAWIISGNYRKASTKLIWPKADTIVWLDYSFIRTFGQLLNRTIWRIIDKKEICNGNIESLSLILSKDSIILWFLKTFKQRKQECEKLFSERPYENIVDYIRLRSPAETERFLSGLTKLS